MAGGGGARAEDGHEPCSWPGSPRRWRLNPTGRSSASAPSGQGVAPVPRQPGGRLDNWTFPGGCRRDDWVLVSGRPTAGGGPGTTLRRIQQRKPVPKQGALRPRDQGRGGRALPKMVVPEGESVAPNTQVAQG